MVKQRDGTIINVSSIQGKIAIPFRASYSASKHALQAFSDSLRAELHQYNINVLTVSPGYIKTSLSINAVTGNGEAHGRKCFYLMNLDVNNNNNNNLVFRNGFNNGTWSKSRGCCQTNSKECPSWR